MIVQCSPVVPVDTPRGPADVFFLIDYGRDAQLLFVCFIRETGESWTFESREVRLEKNVTSGVRANEFPKLDKDYLRKVLGEGDCIYTVAGRRCRLKNGHDGAHDIDMTVPRASV